MRLMEKRRSPAADGEVKQELSVDDKLPQCKIKRNYSCNHCRYFTQNPRFHLTHLRDIHGERITINKCNLCLYASRHYQKLVRHMKMVHGSTDGIAGHSRRRASPESSACSQQQSKPPTPPLPPVLYPIEVPAQSQSLSKDLELSRNALKDLAALYFAENHIGEIMTQMEKADAVQLLPTVGEHLFIDIKRKPPVSSFLDVIEKSFSDEGDLKCPCGHVSKCFSEAIIHRRACSSLRDRRFYETSSTCQHCRRCCKSSEELANHLKTCLHYELLQRSHALTLAVTESHPWNRGISGIGDDMRSLGIKVEIASPPDEEASESVACPRSTQESQAKPEATSSSFKKVFKCPRCSFWASTASRFHVHVVGHLNKKPFKCSLCTYRSNWRWDITKHIRLKSIRNPCHKNARVLMNDDTGRRNYTKYNKYLTLMRINDEDGDSKLIKSGEMTPNQVASLGYLGESSPSDLANDVAVTESGRESSELALDNENQVPTMDEKEMASSPIVKFSDDLVVDVRSDGLRNERLFKCRKCCYRHANRDAVLAHIRIHYQTIQMGLPSSTSKGDARSSPGSEGLAAATSLTRERITKAVRGEESSAPGNRRQADDASQKTAPPSGDDNLGGPASGAPSAGSSSFTGDASKSAMLMDAITASNFCNNPPEKKVSSPFRCGHCHQVSNWKHVIQRHCRLKHSGNIQIEAFDRSSDDRSPVYRAIDFCGNEQKRHSKGIAVMKAQQQMPSCSDSSGMAIKGKSVLHQPDASISSCNSHDGVLVNRIESSSSPYESKTSRKQLKCPPVAHEPPQFKCTVCSYVCAKRQLLTNHLKVHESATDPKPSDSPEVMEKGDTTYRPKCPQGLINGPRKQKQGQKSLLAGREVKSECDLATNQETVLMSHSLVRKSECANRSQDKAALQLPKTDSATKSTNSQQIGAKNASKTVSIQNSPRCSHSSVDSKKSMSCASKSHLQHPIRRGTHLCEYCDFNTSSRDDLDQHTSLHFKSSSNQSPAASHTKHELTIADNREKKNKYDKLTKKTIPFEPTTVSKEEKKEKIANIRKRKCSTDENAPTPASANHRTILFNPKTGQVIRRN